MESKKKVIKYESLIQKLQKENIFYYSIEIEDEYICFLKKPDRITLKQVISLIQKDNIAGMFFLLQNTWLGGDTQIMEDSELFLSVIAQMGDLFEKFEVLSEKTDDGNFKFTIDNKTCILRKPKINELSKLFSTLEKDPLGASELFINTCWISGDEDIIKNDNYFLSLSPMLEKVLSMRNATLKKN